ncbi:MAG: hypothetical protein A2V90_09635 [Gammaproteobacteria bacterium RBG_16_57_12]|nr:MAG: hypothetical protein A2V90_09635 [Gammaproteobacteria bacterium RBG_16_57_12]
MAQTAKLLQDAIVAFGDGNLARLRSLCKRVLAKEPCNADAHHLLGLASFREGDVPSAISQVRRALNFAPNHAEALNNLGFMLRSSGDLAAARECFERAVALRPQYLDALNNLGDIQRLMGEPALAAAVLERALALAPSSLVIRNNLSLAYRDLKRYSDAIMQLQAALAGNPDHFETLHNLAYVLRDAGRFAEAAGQFEQLVPRVPEGPKRHAIWYALARLYMTLERFSDARACFQRLLDANPQNTSIRYWIDSLDHAARDRSPAEFVRELFDAHADSFDEQLLGRLNYGVPTLMVDALRAELENAGPLDVLDLGCGTGLVGQALGPLAGRLVGIDLSPKMLEQASQRGYHRLIEGDLETAMAAEPAASFDLVTAGDVFVYLGNLDGVIDQTRRLLRPNGCIAFSVERASGDHGYELHERGRFAHAAGYLDELAQRHGFASLRRDEIVPRREGGKDVAGFLCLWRLDSR